MHALRAYVFVKEKEIFIYRVYFDIFCRLGLVIDEMSFEGWNSTWASCMQMKRDILFLVTEVTWYFCFSQGVYSIRGLVSSLLVLRKCFRGDDNILIWKSWNVYMVSKCRWLLFFLVACKYREIFFFLVTNGNLTLLFFTRE